MRTNKLKAGFVATALALAGGIAAAQPASAADPVVTVKHRAYNMTNFNQVLAECSSFPGGTCSIERTTDATRTIETEFGLSRSFVSGKLNISSAYTARVTVKCGAYTMTTTRRRMVAYPVGTQIFYTITANGRTSGTLMAFQPAATSTACHLYA